MTVEGQYQRTIEEWMDALDRRDAASLRAAGEQLSQHPTSGLLLAAVRSDSADDTLDCAACHEQLPEFIHSLANPDRADFSAVRLHLRHCPYCLNAFVEVTQIVEASNRDAIPIAQAYPPFTVPSSPATSTDSIQAPNSQPRSSALFQLLDKSLESGQRWLHDAANGLMVRLAGGHEMNASWALKSGEDEALLAQTVITEEETGGWEIDVSAFALANELCQVEVALLPPQGRENELAGIAVALVQKSTIEQAVTDDVGVVTFSDIRGDSLPHIGLHISLPDTF